MTTAEFSNEFDLLWNNIMSNAAPGLDEYEKSVFLTQAQEALVIEIYSGKYSGNAFENTEESRRYIGDLIRSITISDKLPDRIGVDKSSIFYQIPSDVWFRTYEAVNFSDPSLGCADNKTGLLKVITQDEFYSTNRNPFRGPNTRKVLRLDYNDDIIEIVSKYNISSYYLRYLIQPKPIILADLSMYNVSINGQTTEQTCTLNEVIHRPILNMAVDMAKQAWTK